MGCIACGRYLHSECEIGCEDCHGDVDVQVQQVTKNITGEVGRPLKNPEDMKDPKSTGRKRAAKLYPIMKTDPCEWRMKKNCGGGLHPIVGCFNGFQVDRHHGPDKDTRRNERANIHLICKTCHNRWHAKNNEGYDRELSMRLPHSPESATEAEVLEADKEWRLKKL